MAFSTEQMQAAQAKKAAIEAITSSSRLQESISGETKARFRSINATRTILALSALLISLSVAYYYVISLPEQEHRRAAKQKLFLDVCLYGARLTYEQEWAAECESVAAKIETGLQNCLKLLDEERCGEMWGQVDSSATCSLPTKKADYINHNYERARDECFKRYPQG